MKLTSTDRELLYELDFNARRPLSQIAKKLHTSKQALNYRLDRLEKKGIIQGYYADINSSKLGLTIFILYFKFHNFNAENEKQFIKHLNAHKRISVNAAVHGKWDHSIAIFAESIHEYQKIYQDVMKGYEKFVKEKLLTIVTDFWYYKPKYLFKCKENPEITMSGSLKPVELDAIDKKLLKLLAENARMSLLELGKKVNLSANAVKARMKNLEKQGVILGYRVMIDHEKLKKLHYRMFFFLENNTRRQNEFKAFLAQQPEVISITKTAGYADIECRMLVDDVTAFYMVLEKLKERFSDLLKDFEPIIYFKFY